MFPCFQCFPRPPTFALSSKKERLIAGDPIASQQTFSGVRLRERLVILWFQFSLWVLYFAGILFADFLHRHFFIIAKNANSKTCEAKYQQQGFPRRVFSSMQCRSISGGRKLLVYVRIVVLNRHLWCYDGGRLGRVKIVTLRIGARAKEGERGGGGEKKMRLPEIIVLLGKLRTLANGAPNWCFLFSLPAPYPAPFDSPHFLLSFRVSTWRSREQSDLHAWTKRLHCRLGIFGMEDLNKIHCGIRKNAKYLVRKRDLTATREAGFTKIWTRKAGIFLPVCREFEECGNCESTRREISSVSSAVLSPASFLPLFSPASSY